MTETVDGIKNRKYVYKQILYLQYHRFEGNWKLNIVFLGFALFDEYAPF